MKIKRFVSSRTFSCNVYVVATSKANFMVDPGYASQEIFDYIDSIGGISFILLTHGHFDHITGCDEFVKRYQVPVYAYPLEEEVIYNPSLNGSKLFLGTKLCPSFQIEYLVEGTNLIKGLTFEVLHTPGHTKGSICIYLKEEKILFLGDFLFLASMGRTDLPTGDDFAMQTSFNKFKKWPIDQDTTCYPGHDSSFSYEKLKLLNPYLK